MRAVVQRVGRACVRVEGGTIAEIGHGLLVLVGAAEGDTVEDAAALAEKIVSMRVFPDRERRMNQSVVDAGGEVLLVSQFTLLGDVRKGRRPSFSAAAAPELAEPLVDAVAAAVGAAGVTCSTGVFGAMMDVELVNEGPVTLILDVAGGRVQ